MSRADEILAGTPGTALSKPMRERVANEIARTEEALLRALMLGVEAEIVAEEAYALDVTVGADKAPAVANCYRERLRMAEGNVKAYRAEYNALLARYGVLMRELRRGAVRDHVDYCAGRAAEDERGER